jgi:hypothetical protein
MEVTNLLTLKRYKTLSRSAMGGGSEVVEDVSSLGWGGNDNHRGGIVALLHLENNNDDKCCPICLVDFMDGSKMHTLLCGHDFNR